MNKNRKRSAFPASEELERSGMCFFKFIGGESQTMTMRFIYKDKGMVIELEKLGLILDLREVMCVITYYSQIKNRRSKNPFILDRVSMTYLHVWMSKHL